MDQTLVDAEGIRRAGTAVDAGRSFDWELPEVSGAHLRFAWSAREIRGEARLVVELLPGLGEGLARGIAGWTHSFPAAPVAPILWNEDVVLPGGSGPRRLRLRVEPATPFFLSDLRLVWPESSPGAVVLLLFDTTRRDAVGFGGCKDPSTPNLDAILRDAWKATRAYAPASWTIPSVASLLTGRVPAAHEDADGSPLGIVPDITTLAEDFRRAGWSTAAFTANPTVRAENGFAAGFQTFFTTPLEGASITMPGGETIKHVPGWLEAHRGEPFFLLIHLLDPHDPYIRFDRPRGYTPFDPDYRGPIVGDEVNRLQLGEMPRPEPSGVRHLSALYHDEVALSDGLIGRLWDAQPAAERSRWTVVFTSDHGEEFGEHGGWKHGPALFDEVLRVPLAIRPGGGRRFPDVPSDTLVSLLDVLPTVEQLAGLPRPGRPLDGASLIDPVSWRRGALPAITMLTGGAPRAVIVRRERKLFFFDRLGTRGIPDPVKDPAGYRLALRLPELMPGLGCFDLAADPGETRLKPVDRSSFPADWRAVERAMGRTRRGIEMRVVGARSPSALVVTVEGLSREASLEPFALEENDRFSWNRTPSGRTLTAELDLSDGIDGFRFEDPSTSGLRVRIGDAGGCAELRLAGSRPLALLPGQPREISRGAIPETIPLFDTPGGCAGVFLWKATGRPPTRTEAEKEEAWEKLRALGYLH
jgi:arylsulfatase A-like enzyme